MMLDPAHSPQALTAVAIFAEDTLAGIDRDELLHRAHQHLLCAMKLLAGHV